MANDTRSREHAHATGVIQRTKKAVYRCVRFHWLTERVQYLVRGCPTLKIAAINLELTSKPSEVMIDCGANVGDVTSLFARTGVTVYAFEPNPFCFDILSKRFGAMPRVRCFNQGVFDRRCTMTLRTPNPHGKWDAIEASVAASFIEGAMKPDEYSVREVQVECIDLAEFIRSLGGRVRLLKMDIEGAELTVFNHLMNTGVIELIDLIVAETHERQMPHLLRATNALRERIRREGLERKIRLDWN